MVTKATNSVLNLVSPPIDQLVLATPLAGSSGGTGRSDLGIGNVLIGNGVGPVTLVAPWAAGTVLFSNGPGVAPSFQYIDASIITGVLSVSHGGTGEAVFSVGALLAGNGSYPLFEIAPSVAGYPLISNGPAQIPSYGNLNVNKLYGTLTVSQGGTGLTSFGIGDVLVGDGTDVIWQVAPGTADVPLVSLGVGWIPGFGPIDLSLKNVSVKGVLNKDNVPIELIGIFPDPGPVSFVVPPGHYWLYGEVLGAGGGGAAKYTTRSGGGGGAGGYAEGWFPVTPGQNLLITVGYGGNTNIDTGTAGAIPDGITYWNGQNGTSSSIGVSGVVGAYMSASGGLGGMSTFDGALNPTVAGGLPGRGYVVYPGFQAYGGHGDSGNLTDPVNQAGGQGGASFYGGGAYAPANSTPSGANSAPGSGGGGGWGGTPVCTGSNGMHGMVILRG